MPGMTARDLGITGGAEPTPGGREEVEPVLTQDDLDAAGQPGLDVETKADIINGIVRLACAVERLCDVFDTHFNPEKTP